MLIAVASDAGAVAKPVAMALFHASESPGDSPDSSAVIRRDRIRILLDCRNPPARCFPDSAAYRHRLSLVQLHALRATTSDNRRDDIALHFVDVKHLGECGAVYLGRMIRESAEFLWVRLKHFF